MAPALLECRSPVTGGKGRSCGSRWWVEHRVVQMTAESATEAAELGVGALVVRSYTCYHCARCGTAWPGYAPGVTLTCPQPVQEGHGGPWPAEVGESGLRPLGAVPGAAGRRYMDDEGHVWEEVDGPPARARYPDRWGAPLTVDDPATIAAVTDSGAKLLRMVEA